VARAEAELRQLIEQPNGPEEIYALLSEGTWGGVGQRALLVINDHTQFRCDDGNGRTRDREFGHPCAAKVSRFSQRDVRTKFGR
jgi:hypothetical protein